LSHKTPHQFPKFIQITNKKNEIVGQLGIKITKEREGSTKFLKRITKIATKLGARGSWVNGPIIFSDNKETRIKILELIIKALDKISKENNLMIVDGYSPPLDFLIDNNYTNQFVKNGYKKENFITFISSLKKSADDLWSNVKKSARNDVTKAQRENIIVKEINDEIELINYKKLTQKWAKTKGIDITNAEQIDADWKYLKSGIQKFFLAYQNNIILAGLRIGVFNNIAYTHQVLNSYSKAGNAAGPLLTWHAIEWAKNEGYRVYDFSGGGAPPKNGEDQKRYDEQWKSLFAYKRKWGGEEFPYFHFVKIINKKRYKLFRILSKPDWIARNYKKKHFTRPKKEKLNEPKSTNL